MATYGHLTDVPGLKAAADLSSYQHRFLKYSAAGKVTYCGTSGEPSIGVLQNKPAAANRACDIAGFNGTMTKVVAGAAVSAGATVMTDTAGRAITHTTGKCRLGVAFSAASGAGELIDVVLVQNGVDIAPNLGVIPLDICAAREIATNDTQNLAAHGGIMASDSTPALARVNGATDKALRLAWAAADVTEIAFPPVAKPHDLDSSADMTVHLWCKMAGATDTPTIDCQFFDGEGDTEAGAATTACGSTLAEEIATIPAAGIGAAPGFFNISLVPAAHGTDILYLYMAHLEYVRKVN
jgi:hypothetical protein